MAQLGAAFDSSRHEDMRSFEPLPADEYLVQITKSEVKDTRDKTGKYISLEFTVMNGEFKGRKVWTNLNIVNRNPVAVDIAKKELATICRACGKGVIQDTNQLHMIPILMKLRITPPKGDYPAKNEPTGYRSAEGGSQGKEAEPSFVTEGNFEEEGSSTTGENEDDSAYQVEDDEEAPW